MSTSDETAPGSSQPDEFAVVAEPQQQTEEEQRVLQEQQPAVAQETAGPVERAAPLTPDQERTLGELLAKRDAAAAVPTVRLKVEPPHSSVTVNFVTVGPEFTEVPESAAAAIMQGANDAGVTITQDQES